MVAIGPATDGVELVGPSHRTKLLDRHVKKRDAQIYSWHEQFVLDAIRVLL